jgi:hypothetical protein
MKEGEDRRKLRNEKKLENVRPTNKAKIEVGMNQT